MLSIEKQAEILRLLRQPGMSQRAIASIVGCSRGAVSSVGIRKCVVLYTESDEKKQRDGECVIVSARIYSRTERGRMERAARDQMPDDEDVLAIPPDIAQRIRELRKQHVIGGVAADG